jgi:hypothetical protein
LRSDHLHDVFGLIAEPAREPKELADAREHGAPLGSADDANTTAPSEVEDALGTQYVKSADHGVLVDA